MVSEDRLSRVFAALADPTRRDIVARLAGRGRDGRRAGRAVRRLGPGGVQAPEGARGRRAGEPQPRRPAAAVPPRGGGVRPDDQVDRALPPAGRGAVHAASTPCWPRMDEEQTAPRSDRTDSEERHHDHDQTQPPTETTIEADPGCPTVRDRPRVRRPARAGLPRLDRPGAGRAAGSARAASTMHDRPLGRPHRRQLPLRRVARRRGHRARFYGSFHEVRPNERLVQTFTYDGAPDGVRLETMTFEDLGDGRTRVAGSRSSTRWRPATR